MTFVREMKYFNCCQWLSASVTARLTFKLVELLTVMTRLTLALVDEHLAVAIVGVTDDVVAFSLSLKAN